MILANGCNITKSEKFKGVWILSVPTVYQLIWGQNITFLFFLAIYTYQFGCESWGFKKVFFYRKIGKQENKLSS